MIEPFLAFFAFYVYAPLKLVLVPFKLAMVPAGTLLNAIRGGRYLPEFGTAKKMWLAAAVFAALAMVLYPLPVAIAIGLAYVVWDCLIPWGRWFTLNRLPRELSAGHTLIEKLIERVSDFGGVRRDRVAFLLRNLACLTLAGLIVAIAAGNPHLLALAVTTGNVSLVWAALAAAKFNVLWLVPVTALGQSLAYELGWCLADRINPKAGVSYSEHLMGALWGAMIGFGAGL